MAALRMHEVPAAVANGAIDARSEVVVPPRRPGRHAPHVDAVQLLHMRQLAGRISRQHRDFDVVQREPAANFVDVRFHAAHTGEVTRRCYQQAQGALGQRGG